MTDLDPIRPPPAAAAGAATAPAPAAPRSVPGRRRLGMRLLLMLLLAVAAAGVWVWHSQPIEVAVTAPRRGPAIEAVYATGLVEAVESARVGSTVAGRIAQLAVEEGARVLEGQLLAQLDDRQATERLAEAEARLALAEQELARDLLLATRAVRSEQQVQRSRQARDSALAAVELARRQREEYRILSPLDGVVMRRPVQPGETVAANGLLYEIAALGPLRVAADVDERDIARVREGARVALRAEAFPGRVIEARVTHLRARGDSATRTFRVEAALPDDSALLIGMTVDVNIVVAERAGALLLPPTAVRHGTAEGGRAGPAHVFRLAAGRAVRTPVELGAAGPAAIEIRAGLAEDATVLADPPPGLADGAHVEVRQ